MIIDKALIDIRVLEKHQEESARKLVNNAELLIPSENLLEEIIQSIVHIDGRRHLLHKKEDVIRIIGIAFLTMNNRYNTDQNFRIKLKKDYNLSDNITDLIQDRNVLVNEIISLKKYNNTFAPLSFQTIYEFIDFILQIDILVGVMNELGNDGIKSFIKKNGKEYENKSSTILKIYNAIKKASNNGNTDAIGILKKIESIGPPDMKSKEFFKHLLHSKIENFVLPFLFENCFLEFEEISDRQKIKTIFPILLLIHPEYKARLDNKNQADSEKEVIDIIYNKIYRRSR